jgi:hypothetical protein
MRRGFKISFFSTCFLLSGSVTAIGVNHPQGLLMETGWNQDWVWVMISLGIIFLLAARPLSEAIPPEVESKAEAEPKAEQGGGGTLTLSAGGQLGKSYPIGEKGLIVGRDPGQCDIVISDPNVSRLHAWVTMKKGEVVVIDRGSTNGTYVNNVKVENAKLKSGDVIQLGRKCMTTLIFKQ